MHVRKLVILLVWFYKLDILCGQSQQRQHLSNNDEASKVNIQNSGSCFVSPCPSIFSYEGCKSTGNRWFGLILVTTEERLDGLRLDITLTRAAQLLGNWDGDVTTKDNIHFTIINLNKKLLPGPPSSVRIFVKFDNDRNIPHPSSIRLNGREICSSSRETTEKTSLLVPAHRVQVTRIEMDNRHLNEPNRDRPHNDDSRSKVFQPQTYPQAVGLTSDINLSDGRRDTKQQNVCGRVEVQATPLITNGQKTSRGQWPWHAALYQSKNIDLSYICGGSLIGLSTVLTAAHCVTRRLGLPVDPDTLVVYLGKYHLKLWSEGGVQDKQVANIYIHPTYNSSDFSSDIAILILSSPAEYTVYVRPVCLWNFATELEEIEGKEGTVVGWGYDEDGQVTEELMMAKMPIVSLLDCVYSYAEFFSHFTNNKTYCAGFRNGTSVCNGDSGGGMVFPFHTEANSEVWYIRGLVSVSVSQQNQRVCDTRHYVVYTDVAKYTYWIKKFLK